MASTDRRAREQAAVRERILAAARELFLRHGYEAVSLRKIAEAIEYTPPAIYTHFADKNELLKEMCRQDFHAFAQSFVRLRKIEHPVRRLARMCRAYVRFAMEHPNHYRLMFMTPHPEGLEPEAEDLARKGDPDVDGYQSLLDVVGELVERDMVLPECRDAELLAQVIWAGVHGIASLEITHCKDSWIGWRSLEKRSRTMGRALLRGLLRPEFHTEIEGKEGGV